MQDKAKPDNRLTGISRLVKRIQSGERSAEGEFVQMMQTYLSDSKVRKALHEQIGKDAHKLSLGVDELIEEVRQDTLRRCLERARRDPDTADPNKSPAWDVRSDGESATLALTSMLRTEAGEIISRHLGTSKKGSPRTKGLKTAPAKWEQRTAAQQDLASDESSTLRQAEIEGVSTEAHDQRLDVEVLLDRLSRHDARYVPIARGLMSGMTRKEIARDIGASERTVGTLIARMRAIAPLTQMEAD